MTAIYIAIMILSVINIAIACINLYISNMSERIKDYLDLINLKVDMHDKAINARLDTHDKAIKAVHQLVEEEHDILSEVNDNLKNAE